jgi:hypothetical protein
MNKIFVSYNPSVNSEQSLALRLQTLGSLYGLNISLPDRIGSITLKDATKQRIQDSNLFIVFSTRNLSKSVREEITFARTLKKKIIVIYDKDVGKNLKLKGVVEVEYDHKEDRPEKLINKILTEIRSKKPSVDGRRPMSTKAKNEESDSFGAFLLVGLGLLLLAAFMSESGKK